MYAYKNVQKFCVKQGSPLSLSDADSHAVRNTAKRNLDAVGKHWSDSQKIEAVTTWLMLGNAAQSARVLGVPIVTFRYWKASQWWRELESELRLSEKLVLSTRLKNIVETALGQVEDRLANGEVSFAKDGSIRRKPVALRDANKVLTDLMDRREKLVTTEEIKMQEEGVKEKLEKLAKQFETFAQKQQEKIVNVTDVVFATETPNALHEEGSER